MEGHAVERKGRQHSSLPKRLNDQAIKLAKKSLIYAIASVHVIKGNFPFKLVKFKLLGKGVCGSTKQALGTDWGYQAALALFLEKNIVCKEDFHIVWWEGLGAAMAWYLKLHCVWLGWEIRSEFHGIRRLIRFWTF